MLIRTLNNLCASRHLLFLAEIALLSIILACSNSQSVDDSTSITYFSESTFSSIAEDEDNTTSSNDQEINSCNSSLHSSSSIIYTNYLPLDDSEYPYAGLPRIVIETENHQEIVDKETEIPAKLQIWGKFVPESKVLDLTIRGRGNTTWKAPKKPYTITFKQQKKIGQMKEAKKWIFLANYYDRTLIRNAVAFEIARKTKLEWTPNGMFAEIFLNKKFLGNYYICEKIQINKNRLNINKNAFLLEFDTKYDEEYKFKSKIKDFPINIKNPENPSKAQYKYIQDYIDTVENILYANKDSLLIEDYLDLQSFADNLIVFELTQNSEPTIPKSVFMYKDDNLLKAGPLWDFDWGTFTEHKTGWTTKKGIWFSSLLSNSNFKKILIESWNLYLEDLKSIPNFIDSLAKYTHESNDRNIKLWPIEIKSKDFPDKKETFDKAISMMKNAYRARINELDSLFSNKQ